MTGELLIAIASSGALGGVASGVLALLKQVVAHSVSSEARVMEVVHDVYDETVDMMRGEINDNREQLRLLREKIGWLSEENIRLRSRVQFLESFIVQRGLEIPD